MNDPITNPEEQWARNHECKCPECNGEVEIDGVSEPSERKPWYEFIYFCNEGGDCSTAFTVRADQELHPIGLVEVETGNHGHQETYKVPWSKVRRTRISGQYRKEQIGVKGGIRC